MFLLFEESKNELIEFGMEGKNMVGKQKISCKYDQLVEKCNSLHVSISCVLQISNFHKMDSVMPA